MQGHERLSLSPITALLIPTWGSHGLRDESKEGGEWTRQKEYLKTLIDNRKEMCVQIKKEP
jgi:hypothetical protein